MSTIERCPHCKGEGYLIPTTSAKRAIDAEWKELKSTSGCVGAALGFTGALAFGGSWAMGFFVMIIGFIVGVHAMVAIEKKERRGSWL